MRTQKNRREMHADFIHSVNIYKTSILYVKLLFPVTLKPTLYFLLHAWKRFTSTLHGEPLLLGNVWLE